MANTGRRILSIQGGGVNGIFAAQLIAKIEDELEAAGRPARAGEYFDMIAGTSTGGLIALALALRIPAATIVDLYLTKSSVIFPKGRGGIISKGTRYISNRPWYNPDALVKELKAVFSEKRLSDAKTRLIIPTYNPLTGVRLFKTAHHENFRRDFKCHAWDIGAATAAAPVYFPAHNMVDGTSHVDGGVWANNPTQIAVVEGINYCGWNRRDMEVLCIRGIQDVIPSTSWARVQTLPAALIQAQVHGSISTAKTLLGDVNNPEIPHGRYVDFVQNTSANEFALDNADSVQELSGLAGEVYMRRGNQIRDMFFTNVSSPFVSLYS